MQDLKYLSVADLEKYLVNLHDEITQLKAVNPIRSHRMDVQIAEDEEICRQIEAEIFERTVLGTFPDGGSTQ